MGSINKNVPIIVNQNMKAGGEITVNLVLTIKLDSSGLSVVTMSQSEVAKQNMQQHVIDDDDDIIDFIVPKFENKGVIQFGDKVE